MANLKKHKKKPRVFNDFWMFSFFALLCCWVAFLIDFWSIWEAKIDEKSIKIGSKIKIKINPKNDWIFDRFLMDLGSILGGFWEPKSIKNRSKWDVKKSSKI